MNTLHLPTATLDDIVFEGRNKAYGAFVLRRLYHQHLTRAALIAFSLFLLLVSIPVLINRIWPTAIPTVLPVILDDPGITMTEVILPPPTQPEAAIAPPAPVVVTPMREEVPPRVVPDEQVKMEPLEEKTPVALTPGTLGELERPGVIGGSATGKIGDTGTAITGSDSGSTVAAPATPAKPFEYAEVMPEFAGGPDALRKFMQKNLHYPSQALANNIAGKVYVSFVVNTDGSITNVEIVKGLGYGTDEEAMRVIRKMPTWTPGRQNSHAVPVRYTMPITFKYE